MLALVLFWVRARGQCYKMRYRYALGQAAAYPAPTDPKVTQAPIPTGIY